MLNTQHAITSRYYRLADELTGICDPEFDAVYDELEREFQELRLQFGNHE